MRTPAPIPALLLVLSAATATAMASGCGHAPPPRAPEPVATEAPPPPPPAPPPPAPSLYERVGKRDALEGIVEELLGNVFADNRISKLFDKAKKDKDRARQLRERLVAELCVVSSGDDCTYDGKPMKEAHRGMNIGESQWDAFMEDLAIALKTRNVDDSTAKELVDKLAEQTKADVMSGKGK